MEATSEYKFKQENVFKEIKKKGEFSIESILLAKGKLIN